MASRISHKSRRSSASRSRLIRILAMGMAAPTRMPRIVTAAINSTRVKPALRHDLELAVNRLCKCHLKSVFPAPSPRGSIYDLDHCLSGDAGGNHAVRALGDGIHRRHGVVARLVQQK